MVSGRSSVCWLDRIAVNQATHDPDASYAMKKIKYFYNTHTLRYEKLVTPLRVKLLRIFGFLAAALVTSVIISYFAFQFVGSPAEKILKHQNDILSDRYLQLNDRVKTIQEQMSELEKRDNEVYRTI